MAGKKKSLRETLKENRQADFEREALDAKQLYASGTYKKHLKSAPKGTNAKHFAVMATIAKQTSDAQWLSFMKTHELPPVKLSPTEMEALQGGNWITNTAESLVDLVYNINDYAYYRGKM